MNAVEQNISLLDGGLILVVFGIGTVRLDDASHFIDAAVKTAGSDETRQLPTN